MEALLDTHILLYWFTEEKYLSKAQKEIIESATPEEPLFLSDISLWEVATLYSLGRILLGFSIRDWLERAAAPPLVSRVGVSPAVAAEVTGLPDSFHRDPADRIIVATARVIGAILLTHDRRIIDSGIVLTVQ